MVVEHVCAEARIGPATRQTSNAKQHTMNCENGRGGPPRREEEEKRIKPALNVNAGVGKEKAD